MSYLTNYVCKTNLGVDELRELLGMAEKCNFTQCDLAKTLRYCIGKAERCQKAALQFVGKKHRTRSDNYYSLVLCCYMIFWYITQPNL